MDYLNKSDCFELIVCLFPDSVHWLLIPFINKKGFEMSWLMT